MGKLKTMNQRGDAELRKAVAELRKSEGAWLGDAGEQEP
jgi:hypothetical protein